MRPTSLIPARKERSNHGQPVCADKRGTSSETADRDGEKTNTQLICLSGLGGDSIYNQFDNIYVLKLIESSIEMECRELT